MDAASRSMAAWSTHSEVASPRSSSGAGVPISLVHANEPRRADGPGSVREVTFRERGSRTRRGTSFPSWWCGVSARVSNGNEEMTTETLSAAPAKTDAADVETVFACVEQDIAHLPNTVRALQMRDALRVVETAARR